MLKRVKAAIVSSNKDSVRCRIVPFRSYTYTLRHHGALDSILEEETVQLGDPLLLNPIHATAPRLPLEDTYGPLNK